MKTIILCAGYATRLYPLAMDNPKALLPINSRPLLDYTMENIMKYRDDVILVSNSKFYSHFLDWSKKYPNIKVLDDKTTSNEDRLGGIGDLWFAIEQEKVDEDIIVILGDNIFDFDLDPFVRNFQAKKKTLVGVYKLDVAETKKMSEVELSNGRIVKFEEKPKDPKTGLASIGIYLFTRSDIQKIKDYMKTTGSKDGPGHLIRYLSSIQEVYAYPFEGRWFDIGSREIYDLVNKSWVKDST